MRFAFIQAEKATWPVVTMCRALRVSPAGFYAWRRRPEPPRAREDRRLAVLVREAHERGRKAYGSPRVHADLKLRGVDVGRKRVMRLMRQQGLKGRRRRRFVRTTNSNHGLPVAPNLLARDFSAERPNARWAGDITYLRVGDQWLYLAVVLDLFSRFVVGWAVSMTIDEELVDKALRRALERRCPDAGLLHHSDQGSQYASQDYRALLKTYRITCSMSRKGDCWDNAVVESFFGTLKTELGESFESAEDAERKLFDFIEVFYNQQRLHSTLGYVSPGAWERQAAAKAA